MAAYVLGNTTINGRNYTTRGDVTREMCFELRKRCGWLSSLVAHFGSGVPHMCHNWGSGRQHRPRARDIDHIVVTRRGGVLVLDFKCRNQTSVSDTQAMAATASRARSRAQAVTRSLLHAGRGARHRARVDSMPVRLVVVVWGAEQHRLAGGLTQADGIDFVARHQLRTALRQLEGEVVSKGAAAQMKAALKEFRETSVVLNTEDPTGVASPPPMASPPSLN